MPETDRITLELDEMRARVEQELKEIDEKIKALSKCGKSVKRRVRRDKAGGDKA
jgi:hypothetical protein